MGWRGVLIAIVAFPLYLRGELLAIRTYTTADGLAADRVDSIVADSRGFVWFCTPEGLSRFDGYRIVTFGTDEGLPHRAAQALVETRSGEYVLGTARGLCQFHAAGSGNKFATYPLRDDPPENFISALFEGPSGRIWCGTGGGIFEVLSGLKFRRQTLPAPVHGWDRILVEDIVEDAGGKLWVATTTGIYVIAKDGGVQRIAKEDGLANEWVNVLLLDKHNRLWAGTRSGLALMRDESAGGKCGVQQVYTEKQGLVTNNAAALTEGTDGAIWIGTTNGISRLLPGSGPAVFQNFTRAHGLIDREITALAADRAGNIWAGTEGAGVMRIETAGFTTFREQDGLPSDRVWSVFADRIGTVLAVAFSDTVRGWSVNVFDGVKFHAVVPKVFGERPTWGNNHILLQSRTGEWWAATDAGLCRYARMTAASLAGRQPEACYAQDTLVFQIFEDSKGGIWASAQRPRDRLMRWDPEKKAISWFKEVPERDGLISAFAEDRAGNIWIGLYAGGALFRYDGRQFTRFKRSEGVPAGTINGLLVDHSGRLWIASGSGGLGLVENPGSAQFRVRAYNTGNGLASNTIHCIVEDNAGRIYAGTQKGVDRLNPKTGQVKHFSSADGLAHGRTTSALRDASGNLWFATTQGLSKLTPTPDQPPAIPSVFITDLRVGRERYAVSQVGEKFIARGKLQPSQNQLQIEFVGYNEEPEENLRYTYRLDGGDSEWHAPGRDHQANYPGLAPGSYRFLVKAVNSEGQESAAPAEADFTILPPFWRRLWFETLALASLAGLVFAAHRYRVAHVVQLERVRTAIATDLHDDIGASLSQIAILSEVARTDANLGQAGPNERLERVATLARELVDSMSDIVWSIRAEPDGVESLIRRMREFANDLLASQGIAFELQAPVKDIHSPLGLQTRRQIFLIFKECIHNAARHSGCTAVVAELKVEGREILLRVRDNGRGLNNDSGASRNTGGTGIPSMRRRAESLGGRMELTASPAGGCTVEVHLPVGRSAFGWPAR